MILFLNIARDKIFTAVRKENKFVLKKTTKIKTEQLLLLIDKLFRARRLNIKNIKGIVAGQLGGTFTGTRALVSFANSLAFALGIPVIRTDIDFSDKNLDKILQTLRKAKKGAFLLPEYCGEPSITMPKQ